MGKKNKDKGNGGSKPPPAPPLPPQQGRPKPPLPGIFEDYYFVEIYLTRPVLSTPIDHDGWYIGAIPHKLLGKNVNTTGFIAYVYDPPSGLIAVPHAFRVNIMPEVSDQGPTMKMGLKYVGDFVANLDAVSHFHTLVAGATERAQPDFSQMALSILERSMSAIVRPPPGAAGLLQKP